MRKNILIIAHSHEPQFIESYNQYTRCFDREKYLVTVLYLTSSSQQEELQKQTLAENIIFAGFDKKKLRSMKLGVMKQLLQLCRANHYDVVICHRYKPTYLMLWVAKFCRIPKIIFVMHAIGTMRSRRRQWFIRLMLQKNMLFAGVSNAVRDDLRKDLSFIPPERIITLYNAMDVEITEPKLFSRIDAKRELKIDDDHFIFGHVARFEKNKAQGNLIRAFSLIRHQCPNARLMMIGDGVKASELKQLVIDLELQERVIFTGRVPYAFRLMRAFDCFVLSSTQEAFGRVLLEAMIAKVPVIGTSAFGIPEVIGDAGLVVPANDVDAMAAAMREVYSLDGAELSQMGEAGYQQLIREFGMNVFMQKFATVLGDN